LETNHQLESRMPEIGQSGSEGGAKIPLSLPLSKACRDAGVHPF
jgi:hypothetical protein